MTRSMTAFTRQEEQHAWGALTWELRSVNHRYLEPHFRLPDSLRDIEGVLRERLRKRISRGKVEATLRFVPEQSQASLQIDHRRLEEVAAATRQLSQTGLELQGVNPLELLAWPGVVVENALDMALIRKAATALFDKALDDLIAGREREGDELKQLIHARLQGVSQTVADVRQLMPEILKAQRNSLKQKLADLSAELDPARLEQEIVLIAQKADVDEELDRLDTHVQEVYRVLEQSGPVGRRLDFLMQELNREANTLSSKSIVANTTRSAVELKVLIEQMREQIQNIE
ncbi:YicC family protein [Marinobacterium sp. AK62]|uniref:YicC family protein n=1 Tax=Marinobacterium alkalitolerans TaxID=1542925 RepID=A0ABS3ZDD9_9GAMM|nr:YicC/YloC family endoribonuclease [Marinobacterium alkalitolerans]MBP0049636.1 YicC family protein [Marinobacterium alkalitolerans]